MMRDDVVDGGGDLEITTWGDLGDNIEGLINHEFVVSGNRHNNALNFIIWEYLFSLPFITLQRDGLWRKK
jgi:hypothetical protein